VEGKIWMNKERTRYMSENTEYSNLKDKL